MKHRSRYLWSMVLATTVGWVNMASAVYVSPDREGEVLLFPYYSTRNDNDTLISVTNTQDEVKAVKVHVREGENGRPVLSFNLYLGPFDVWVASITAANGGSVLRTTDNTCTVPAIYNANTGTGQVNLSLAGINQNPDSGRNSVDRVHEGFIEMIEMGVIDSTGLGANLLFEPQSTDAAGNPLQADCDAIAQAWEQTPQLGIWRDNPHFDLSPPTGGLIGDGLVIQVAEARASDYVATALGQFYIPGTQRPPSLHAAPGSSMPDLTAIFPAFSHVLNTNGITPTITQDSWGLGVLAVSAVLMVDSARNLYASESIIGGASEWVLTLPTMNAHTWPDDIPIPPFSETFDEPQQGQGDGRSCELTQLAFYDRNTQTDDGTPPAMPPPVPLPPRPDYFLCHPVNVLSFADSGVTRTVVENEQQGISSEILGSRLFSVVRLDTRTDFESGWARMSFNGVDQNDQPFTHQLLNTTSGRAYRGLPLLGFAVRAAANRSINALFGTGFGHSYRRVLIQP